MFDDNDYINTIGEASKYLKAKITLTASSVDCWRVRITPYRLFDMETKGKRWWVRLYRRVFNTRAYVKWRVKAYFFRKKFEGLLRKMDEFIAWGDDIGAITSPKWEEMKPEMISGEYKPTKEEIENLAKRRLGV